MARRKSPPPDPGARIVAWLAQVPQRTRVEIAQYVVGGYPVLGADSGREEEAVARLNGHLQEATRNPVEGAMRAAAIAGIIDVVLVGRSSKADWKRAEQTQHRLAKKALRDGHDEFAIFVQQGLGELQERADQWMKAAAAWRRLRGGVLSAQSIGNGLMDLYSDDVTTELLGER